MTNSLESYTSSRLKVAALLLLALNWTALPLTALAQRTSVSINLTNQKSEPLADAVVTFKAANQKASSNQNTEASIAQINKEFDPQVSVVQAGTAISFPNKDKILHHVYSFSEAKSFDLPLYAGTPSEPVTFNTPGLVTLGCNIHDWMRAYVVVVDTPYYQISDSNGSVNIADIPTGQYELEVWHPRQRKPFKDTVDVEDGYSLILQIATKPQLRSRRNSSGQNNRYRP